MNTLQLPEKIDFRKFAVDETTFDALKEMQIAVLAEVYRFGGPIRSTHIVQGVKKNKKVLTAERACR